MRSIQESIKTMIQEHKLRKHLIAPVSMIAIATVFVVVWSLHINGITMTSADLICGMEEHVHTDDCYAWVVMESDGTELEPTEGTEGTEEPEEGTEAIDATGEPEGNDSTETENAKKTEATAVSESASETADLTETESAEGTEAVAEESTEDTTEELTELATEELTELITEGLTEEETETPQPGDTKVVDGVTYVYSLVCETEEHVHTDACYKSAVTADTETLSVDAEESSETTVSADSDNGESGDGDADGSTFGDESEGTDSEDGLDEIAENNEIVTSTTTRLGSSNSSDDDDEESAIATISEEDNSSNTLTSTASEGSYYFADTTALADAADEQDEDYIIYTIIDDTYYLVSSEDGALYACKYLGDVSDGSYDLDDFESDTATEGIYCWNDSEGNLVFKCTTTSATIDIDDYEWTLTSSDADDSGNGTYTIYNSQNAVYLAPEDVGVSEILTSTTIDWWDSIATGQDYEIKADQKIVFTVECTAAVSNYAAFCVEIYGTTDYGTTTAAANGYITTGSNVDGWYAGGAIGDYATAYKGEDSDSGIYTEYAIPGTGTYSTDRVSTITEGTTYTVTVERTTVGTDEYQYVITYYDETSGTTIATFKTGTVSGLSGTINVHIIAQVGTFEISAGTYELKSAANTENSNISDTYSDTNNNNSFTTTQTSLDYTTLSYDKSGSVTLAEDFDVSYTFVNTSNSEHYLYNYVLCLSNGNGRIIYIYAAVKQLQDNYSSYKVTPIVAYNNGTLSTINYSFTQGNYTTSGPSFRNYMASGSDVTINVSRTGNTFTVDVNIAYTSTNNTYTVTAYSVVFTDEEFENCNTSLFLTGLNCTLTNIAITDDAAEYDWVSYDAYAATGDVSKELTLTASGSGFTASSSVSSSTEYLNRAGTSYANWQNSSGFTYYLAKQRAYTVFFDGANGVGDTGNVLWGTIYYRGAGQITEETSIDASGSTYTVEIPYLTYTKYNTSYVQYTLRGWVNIDTGAYYYISDYYTYDDTEGAYVLRDDAPNDGLIKVTANTVFYADWVPETYDIGENTNTVDSKDTSGFIEINLFDYSDIFNLYSITMDTDTTSTTDGTPTYSRSRTSHTERWTLNTSDSVLASVTNILSNSILNGSSASMNYLFLGAGNTGSIALISGRGGSAINSSNYNGSTESTPATEYYNGITTTGIVANTASTDALLSILFNQDNTIDDVSDAADAVLGKTYVGTANYLFQYDDKTGYYYYDSTKNAASYNQSAGRFYVYDYTVMTADSAYDTSNKKYENASDFLPFNYSDTSEYSFGTYTVNYWFGMQTDISFYLPDDSDSTDGSGNNNQSSKGTDMIFKFSGDDDVWVYIDDELVLDLGGMHAAVYGEINFSTGEVTVAYNTAAKTWDSSTLQIIGVDKSGSYGTVTTTTKNFSAGYHEMTVYYLERGASQSNLAVYTNLSTPSYYVKLSKQDAEDSSWLSGAEFTVYTSLKGFDGAESSTLAELTTSKDATTTTSTFTTSCTCISSGSCTCSDADCTCSTSGTTSCTCSECEAYLEMYGLKSGVTYYLVESTAPDGYPISDKIITLVMDNSGNITITVYNTLGTQLETYTYNYGSKALTTNDTGTMSWQYVSESSMTVTKKDTNTGTDYYEVKFTVRNKKEYELPTTGSIGLFPYRTVGTIFVLVAGVGLLLIAYSEFAPVRRRTGRKKSEGYSSGYQEKTKKIYEGTRDRPQQQRSRIYGRDAPVSLSDGSQERRRGTGPGTE